MMRSALHSVTFCDVPIILQHCRITKFCGMVWYNRV